MTRKSIWLWAALAGLAFAVPLVAVVALVLTPKTVVSVTNRTRDPMCDVHVSLVHDRRVAERVEPGATIQIRVKAGGDPYIAVSHRSCGSVPVGRTRLVAFGYFGPYDTIELTLRGGTTESSFQSSSGARGPLEPYVRDAWSPYYRDPFGLRD